MKTEDRYRSRKAPELRATGSPPSRTGDHGRSRGAAAIVIAGLVLLIGTAGLVAVLGNSPTSRTTRPATPVQVGSADDRISTAVGWVQGLADGLISPADVTDRLIVQDPRTGRVVSDVWARLRTHRGSARLASALSWIRGLADGLISPADVTDRLRMQDPSLSKTVVSAWAELSQLE
jgi:hypothetical protein